MRKLPVVSESGNEYIAKVGNTYDSYYGEHMVKVVLLKVVETKSIFGRKKTKEIHLQSSYFNDKDKEFFDYIEAVKRSIKEYEKSTRFIKATNEDSNIKKFKEWDGIC